MFVSILTLSQPRRVPTKPSYLAATLVHEKSTQRASVSVRRYFDRERKGYGYDMRRIQVVRWIYVYE